MLEIFLYAGLLTAASMVIHTVGVAALFRFYIRLDSDPSQKPWRLIPFLLGLVWWLLLLHVSEILLWGLFYHWLGVFPKDGTAFYFSGTTYTTIGYGDVVMPPPWRFLAPVEGLMGILMCAFSAGVLISVISHFYQLRHINRPHHS